MTFSLPRVLRLELVPLARGFVKSAIPWSQIHQIRQVFYPYTKFRNGGPFHLLSIFNLEFKIKFNSTSHRDLPPSSHDVAVFPKPGRPSRRDLHSNWIMPRAPPASRYACIFGVRLRNSSALAVNAALVTNLAIVHCIHTNCVFSSAKVGRSPDLALPRAPLVPS